MTYVCTACGSDAVYTDAWASVNTSHVITFDQHFCADCEGECSIREVNCHEHTP